MSKICATEQYCRNLFLHLGAITVQIPPLRERPEDIPGLAAWVLSLQGKETVSMIVDEEVYAALRRYAWPGNVDELCTVVAQAVAKARISGDVLRVEHLPEPFAGKTSGNVPRPPADLSRDVERGKWLKQFLKDQSQKLSSSVRENQTTGK